MTWRRERGERLDALMDAHIHAGGPNQRRRWLTAVLSEALFLRLAAEFQGFARDLHDQACDVFASWIAPDNPAAKGVVNKQFGQVRSLERGKLDILADNLDAETAAQLGRLFGRKEPW